MLKKSKLYITLEEEQSQMKKTVLKFSKNNIPHEY